MPATHLLRVPRAKEKGDYVLVQVSSAGSKPLDLRLIATEGVAPYCAKLRHNRIRDLKAKNQHCSDDEWEQILTSLLLEQNLLEDVEASAEVSPEKSILLSIKKRIQGITQRLGELTLDHDEREEIALFDWCGTALDARDKLKEDIASSARQTEDLEKAVTSLKKQLDELIAAKTSDETELLEKFRALLNEKKAKIREQQRMLAEGRTNDEECKARSGSRRSQAKEGSKPTKRKAREELAAMDESDDGFEKMEVDSPKPAQAEDQASDDQATTDQDETASEADDQDEDGQPAQPVSRPAGATATSHTVVGGHDLRVPPKRQLPFEAPKGKGPEGAGGNSNAAKEKPPPPPAGTGSETESDDEL